MAYADYCLCDLCGGKAFYDANIEDERYHSIYDHKAPDPIGLAVLCGKCNKTHEAVIQPRAALEGRT